MFLTRVGEEIQSAIHSRTTGAQSTTQEGKTITTMRARSLLQSRGRDHFEIQNTLVTLEITLGSIRHAIPKSVFLVIRSPAESLEPHRRRFPILDATVNTFSRPSDETER